MPVRTHPGAIALGRCRGGPHEQAPPAAHHPAARDGPILLAGGARVLARCPAARVLRLRGVRRVLPSLRQPGAPFLRQRDGPPHRRAQRGHPLQRHGQHLAHRRARHRRYPHRDRRLRLGVHHRRRVLRDGAGGPVHDAPRRAAPGCDHPARPRPDPRRGPLHHRGARAVGDVPDAARHRRHQLQLRRHLPVVRRAGSAPRRPRVHAALLDLQRRRARRRRARGPPTHRDRPHHRTVGGCARRVARRAVGHAEPDPRHRRRRTGGRRQRRLHDRHHRLGPDPHRAAHDRPGARHPDRPAHRHHPDRWAAARRRLRHGRCPGPMLIGGIAALAAAAFGLLAARRLARVPQPS